MSKNNRNAQQAAGAALAGAAQQAAGAAPEGGAATPLQGQGPEGPQRPAEAAPQGRPVRLRGPGRGSVSVAGVEYAADEDGTVEVAPEHAPHLIESHGYEQA